MEDLNVQGTGSPMNPGLPGNQLGVAMSNTLSAVRAQCDQFNAKLIAAYTLAHNDWNRNQADRPDNTPEPQPPMAYVVGSFTDPTSGPGAVGPYGEVPIQWATPVVGTHPVCAPLPGPVVNWKPTLKTEDGGLMGGLVRGGGAVAANPFNSTVALYVQQVTAPDGSVFVRIK